MNVAKELSAHCPCTSTVTSLEVYAALCPHLTARHPGKLHSDCTLGMHTS